MGGVSKEESECPLCRAVATEQPISAFIGGASWDPKVFVVLPTKETKGHRCRFMIVSKEHVTDVENPLQAEAFLYYFMRTHGTEVFDILMPTHATVTTHFHRVACSTDDSEATDWEQIFRTERITVRNVKVTKK